MSAKAITRGMKKKKVCPFWITETVVSRDLPEAKTVEVSHCLATGRNRCLRDIHRFNNCEFYLEFRKSREEATPGDRQMPRWPVPSHD